MQVLHRRLPDYALDPDREPETFAGLKGLSSLPLVKV